MCFRVLLTVLVCLLASNSAVLSDEQLPPPRPLVPAPAPAPAPAPYQHYGSVPIFRVSQYAHWDLYEVDRLGYFRPRVIATPYKDFYLYNGAPYPWATTNPRNYIPNIRN